MAAISFARLADELFASASALERAVTNLQSFDHISFLLREDVEDTLKGGSSAADRSRQSLAALTTVQMFVHEEGRFLDLHTHKIYELSRQAKEAAKQAALLDIDARR